MKNLEIADEIFDSLKLIKKIFSDDMATYISGRAIRNTPADYISILQELCNALSCINVHVKDAEKNLSFLKEQSLHMEIPEEILKFIKSFFDMIDIMSLNVIQYREYYCIIKRNDSVPGLGSHIITNLGQIALSISEGYIPMIDMINVENDFGTLSRKMNRNAWELFFKQPFHTEFPVNLSGNRWIEKEGIPAVMPNYDMNFLTNCELVSRWKQLLKLYMPFSSRLKERIKLTINSSLFNTKERILGVLCRGTDYTFSRPYNHPVQPTIDEVIAKTTEVMQSYKCKYIYLVTEDSEILSVFKDKFEDMLFTTQNLYYSNVNKNSLNTFNKMYNINLYDKNEEYLIALYLLSKCCCLIGGRTSGMVVSLLFSESFDYFYVWNKGRYGIDDIFSYL